MNREMLRDKLVQGRRRTDYPESTKANGVESVLPGLRENFTGGKKLAEAASYLDSARKAMLKWTRETASHSDNYETDADHLREVLAFCATLQKMKTTIEFKAHLYGENQ